MLRRLLMLGLFTVAASLSAVTVKWQVPNSWYVEGTGASPYSWIRDAGVYFVWLQEPFTGNFNDPDSVKTALYDSTTHAAPKGATVANAGMDQIYNMGSKGLSAVFDGLTTAQGGYYYMVVFNNKPSGTQHYDQYAIAGGALNSTKGVYDSTVGALPQVGDYADIGSFLGGTWSVAIHAPEPTVLALLALGVATVALRRKTV